jgi:hypothetical protein
MVINIILLRDTKSRTQSVSGLVGEEHVHG